MSHDVYGRNALLKRGLLMRTDGNPNGIRHEGSMLGGTEGIVRNSVETEGKRELEIPTHNEIRQVLESVGGHFDARCQCVL